MNKTGGFYKIGGFCWAGCDFISDFKKAILKKRLRKKKNAVN